MFHPELPTEIRKAAGTLEQCIGKYMPLKRKGASYVGDCPKCGAVGKFSVSAAKQVAKCFKCDVAYKDDIAFVSDLKNLDFKTTVEFMAADYGLHHMLTYEALKPPKAPKKATSVRQVRPTETRGNFRDRWMAERDITEDMQRATRIETVSGAHSEYQMDRYTSGTLDYRKNWAVADGPDMVMHYMGLDRQVMTYVPPKGRKAVPMVRVRFQNPELHQFNGNAPKYLSPKGSGLHLWLPNKLIDDYNRPGIIEAPVLTIQEGEGKADRICQVVPTVGIMGIHSLVQQDSALPKEFEQLVERFNTKTIIFFMDADLFELGNNVDDKTIDMRPRTFAKALRKFRHHFHKFQSAGFNLTILMAHPTTLNQGLKGMDDLMKSGLLTDEGLRDAIADGILGKNTCPHLKFYDITDRTDAQINALWHLGTYSEFVEHYAKQIREKVGDGEFKLGKLRYTLTDSNELVPAQQMLPTEQFYDFERDDMGIPKKVRFSNVHLLEFMQNRGFFRFKELDQSFSYIQIEDSLIDRLNTIALRDYVNDYLSATEEGNTMLRNFFLHYHEQYLSDRTFSSLCYQEPLLIRDQRGRKSFVFQDDVWEVSAQGTRVVSRQSLSGAIWRNARINDRPTYMGAMVEIEQITDVMVKEASGHMREFFAANIGKYLVNPTEDGEKCVFLKFLTNASNFYWEKQEAKEYEYQKQARATYPTATDEEIMGMVEDMIAKNHPLSLDERLETQQHLLAKITAIGHLQRKYRSPDADYGIFAMEGNMVEDMRAEGRSGKSLIPKMLAHTMPVVFVDGKKDLIRDIYVFDKVTPETTVVNLDDVDRRFDPTFLYSRMTGDFGVRGMNKSEVQIPYKDAPIFYVSSNYNMLGSDGSTRDRWRAIAFSDFYSADRKPQDIHQHLFYDEWDDVEKSRFYSLLADCSSIYFKLGGVTQAPDERLERRRWKQEIGQTFETWADSVFRFPSTNGNHAVNTGVKLKKLEVLGVEGNLDWSFYARNPDQRKYIKAPTFKRKLWIWAMLNGYEINPGTPYTGKSMPEYKNRPYGGDVKSGSEYITICEPGQDLQTQDEKLNTGDVF
jgi:hypothetical protein